MNGLNYKSNLGIFYTNNCSPAVVSYCLNDIKKFSDQIDILTCSWKPIPGNPFKHVLAATKNRNHLNIIIQILQLLYLAKNINQYEYVSFLEHDVLYPDSYFSFDPLKKECKGFVNMNYIGLSNNGFQKRIQNDRPLHQITMRFNEAVDHFESTVKLALNNKEVFLEPKELQVRHSKDPAIHINHGVHFTTHHRIYSHNIYENDIFWGDGKLLMQKIMGTEN